MPPVVLTVAISRWGSTKITRLVNSWKLPALWRTFNPINYVPLPGSEFRIFCLKINHVSAFTLCPRYSGINYRRQRKQVSRNYLTSLSPLANNIVIECRPILCRLEEGLIFLLLWSPNDSHLLTAHFPNQLLPSQGLGHLPAANHWASAAASVENREGGYESSVRKYINM